MRVQDGAGLLALAGLGGASFLFIGVAAPELGPFMLMATRVAIAAFVLMAAAKLTGQVVPFRAYWRRYLLLGALYGAIPYALIAVAALHIPASMAAVLNATTPLFTAVVSVFWLGEALSARQIAGLLLGLTGVALVVGWTPRSVDGAVLPWALCMLLSSLFYALGSVYAKKALQGVPAIAVAVGQQLGAVVLLLPGALAFRPASLPSVRAVIALILLAVFATALTSHLFFGLVARIGPTRTASVLFLVPLVGIVLGHLFLAEPIGLSMLTGLGVILAGVFLVIGGSVNRKEFANLPKNERKNAAHGLRSGR
jgi:drug/metabolite transporter (DMT)-like permease